MGGRWSSKNPWGGWRGALVLSAGMVLVLVLARVSYFWHQRYARALLALSAINEARHARNTPLKHHLLALAASLLGIHGNPLSGGEVDQTAITALHQLAQTEWSVSPAVWAIAFAVIAVGIYWMREGHIAWLETERVMLNEQLLAIARGWSSLATNPNGRDVMENILSEVIQHTAVASASIYRLCDDRSNSLQIYAHSGNLILTPDPIPRIFIGPTAGLVGEALAENASRYSGDGGESGYLIPGVRLSRVAVFPLTYRNATWGILLLSSHENHWYYVYRELLDVMAQEIAIAATTAELAEEARRNRLMEERARMQSEILANVSHEFRTPLGLVKGYLETLQKSWHRMPPDERREFLDVAVSETHELEGLIDHLLMMSRVEHAENPLDRRQFGVAGWLKATLDHYPVWEQARIIIPDVPTEGVQVYGDPRELSTALSDLLQNGLKYSSGSIEVRVQVAPDAWTVSVRDWGPGVPAGVIEKIWERFYRMPAHAQSEVRGSGLGLSIVKRIVEAHRGQIRAANAAGGGLQVVMTLPMYSNGALDTN